MSVEKVSMRSICRDVGVSHLAVTEVLRRVRDVVMEDKEVITHQVGTFYLKKKKATTKKNYGVSYEVPERQVVALRGPRFSRGIVANIFVRLNLQRPVRRGFEDYQTVEGVPFERQTYDTEGGRDYRGQEVRYRVGGWLMATESDAMQNHVRFFGRMEFTLTKAPTEGTYTFFREEVSGGHKELQDIQEGQTVGFDFEDDAEISENFDAFTTGRFGLLHRLHGGGSLETDVQLGANVLNYWPVLE